MGILKLPIWDWIQKVSISVGELMLLYRMETRITILHDTKRSDLDRTEFSIPNGLFFAPLEGAF